jgi:glycine/D-amino acid oxidase-like deaminating enzyme
LTRLYHPTAFDPARKVDSHWRATAQPLDLTCPPLEGDKATEVAVIGGGFTGLWAAKRLAEEHGAEVVLLDSGEPGWGASGRNGGFCCMGSSKLGYPEMTKRYGLEATRDFVRAQREAVEDVAAFLDAEGEAADRHSDGELALAHKPNRIEGLKEEAAYLTRELDVPARFLPGEELRQMGAGGPEFFAGLHIGCGFALHPLKYARTLARATARAGVTLHGGSEVTAWERTEDGRHRLRTAKGSLTAEKVILATNGYLREDIPPAIGGRFLPVMSNILVTRPLTADEQNAQGWSCDYMAFETRRLLHYFRKLPDGRFLFGGRGGIDASPQGAERMRLRLRRDFERMFPAWSQVETERFWFGFVCLSYDLVPFAGPIEGLENAWAGLAYHGNGVSMTGYVGRALADAAMGDASKIPQIIAQPARRFPLPFLRKSYLRAAYFGYGIKDRWL